MYKVLILISIFTQAAIGANQNKYASMDQVIVEIEIPSAKSATGVYDNGSFVSGASDAFSNPQVEFRCADKTLLPVTASQMLKDYHANYYVKYNHFDLKKRDRACALWSKSLNAEGNANCLRPDVFEIVLMSSLYADKCGNLYRAYWASSFFKREDNMGTLLAKGNTVYQREGSDLKGDIDDGQTYPVKASDFLFFTLPSQKDLKKAADDRARVLKYTHDLNSDGTFSQKK